MHYGAPELLPLDENDATICAFGMTYKLSEIYQKPQRRDGLLGRPLQRVALYILLQAGLVTEHVETRTLHGPTGRDTETGKLQMFVDLLPLHAGPIKPPLDISPRRPVQYQLRAVVWGVHGALLSKTTMGKKVADLYVKCFLEGSKKEERTDIHFRSVDGNASFNWRFVINFDYDIWEQKVVFSKRKRFSRAKVEHLRDPILKIQVCDNNRFQADTLIGECCFDLREFPEAEVDSEGNPKNTTMRTHSPLCCISAAGFCRQALCCTKGHRREFANTPRPVLYKPTNQRTFSLFRQYRTCGWWPCLSAFFPHQTGVSYDALKKKDDDRTKETRYVTANVKLEVELLTRRDADELPVGRKRLEPNRCPYLPAPDRSRMDDHWCTSRLKAATSFFYHAYGRKCLLITAAFSVLVVVVFVIIYRLPGKLLKRIFILSSTKTSTGKRADEQLGHGVFVQ
uniref:C2 domain-containing protein n=1 Tax=Ascaris lumbricoides TaxID=6252 RepID=A0A9J2PV42_ASCLU